MPPKECIHSVAINEQNRYSIREMMIFHKNFTASPPGPWEAETLLINGDEYFASLQRGIEGAQKTIELETYIYDNDIIGNRVTEWLIKAHARGVAVRVIVDGVGAQGWVFDQGLKLHRAGIEYRVYHQLPWERLFVMRRVPSDEPTWQNFFTRVNIRDHRKVCIIDGNQAWVGSLNISDHHLYEVCLEKSWRDTGIVVRGGNVKFLRAAFERLWFPPHWKTFRLQRRDTRRLIKASEGSNVRLNATRRLRRVNYQQLLSRIAAAKVRVWITTGYFVPAGSFLRALTAAANRCVDVRLLTSSKSDVFFMPWVASAFQYGLMRAGVQLYDYLPSMLHAKTIIIDDLGMVGSSNLNHRSLFHDLEADILTTNIETVSLLTEQYLKDLESARGLTLHDFRAHPLWQRAIGRLVLGFKNFL
jgi:cardiolipin synthase A/B